MHISYNWLKQYIDFDWSPEELAEKLTGTGLEVEGLEKWESVEGGLEGVVIGEVLTCEKHANADKLKVTTVDVGGEEPLHIVCGAPNVAVGQRVPVATVGCTLFPEPGKPFEIAKRKVRGEVSEGMICAEDELGIGESHDGILVLPADTPIGAKGADIFGVETDWVFEIGLTANRAEAASHIGTARDIAALLRKPLKMPEIAEIPANAMANPVSIELPNPEKCPRYAGVYIKGITIGESPQWLKNRLLAIGSRPINNIVDITNYVLHETGQPLHAFDADEISGNKIIVKTLDSTQKFFTLDDVEREIIGGDDLMICDGARPVAVAGVMGGQNSEVSEKTVNVFLESAYFDPTGIRRTGSRLGLKTDASYRFERGVDPNNIAFAALRATKLIVDLAGGEVSQLTDAGQTSFPPFEINFDTVRANKIMGTSFSVVEIQEILGSLDIQSEEVSENQLLVKVPPYRVDVLRPQDLMEEILRIYGYNNVDFASKEKFSLDLQARANPQKLRERYFDALAANGWCELVTNPLVPEKMKKEGMVPLVNRLSEDHAVMRDAMLHTGLEVVEHNHRYMNFDLRLFEFGKTYHKTEAGYEEKAWIALYLTGLAVPDHWKVKQGKATFFTLAREMERLMTWFGFEGKIREMEDGGNEFDYGLELVRGEKVIARYGAAAASRLKGRDIKGDVFFGLIDWDALFKAWKKGKTLYQPLPKFPAVRRDISMIVPSNTRFSAISNKIAGCNPKLIREINITDVYRGDKIDEGKTSYLVNLTLLDENKTLTDKTVDKLMDRIFSVLENDAGVTIRK